MHGQSAFLIVRRVMGVSFKLENWALFYNYLCCVRSNKHPYQYPAAVSQLCPSITNGVVCLTHSIPIKRCLHGQSAFLIDRRVMGMSFGLENWAWLISCLFVWFYNFYCYVGMSFGSENWAWFYNFLCYLDTHSEQHDWREKQAFQVMRRLTTGLYSLRFLLWDLHQDVRTKPDPIIVNGAVVDSSHIHM